MTTPDIEKPLLYGVADAARQLGVGRSTVWSLIASGRLRTTKIGRRTLVTRASIEQLAGATS